eukprot:scaffold207187_cov52-Prasinocladus_malaysianus.AAC.2
MHCVVSGDRRGRLGDGPALPDRVRAPDEPGPGRGQARAGPGSQPGEVPGPGGQAAQGPAQPIKHELDPNHPVFGLLILPQSFCFERVYQEINPLVYPNSAKYDI